MTSSEGIAHAVAALTGGAPLRVWSLVVTIFGDLASGEEDWLSGATLGALTAPLGVRPEALRVALHRLRRDGWLESRKAGRGALHRLSATARAETRAAAPRIYERTSPKDLWLILPEPGAPLPKGPVWIGRGVGLTSAPGVGFALPVAPEALAPWMRARIVSDALTADCAAAADGLARAHDLLTRHDLSPDDSVVLRCLAVHIWRRIALKAPSLPDAAFPSGWRGAEARQSFCDLIGMVPARDAEGMRAEVISGN